MSDNNRVVSSESESLILVDSSDQELGYRSKAECHDADGILHRAFSLFLFNPQGELLLQQRGLQKRLWPGFWSNSCCSHPRRGESMAVATQRRLSDELNLVASLEFVYKFQYQARFGDAGSENELCHVYLGSLDGVQPVANASEIAAIRFIRAGDLTAELAESPEVFTPWFQLEWQVLTEQYSSELTRYTQQPIAATGK